MAQQQHWDVMDLVRAAGYAVLPAVGGWVRICGNPRARRGQRLPAAHVRLGLQHGDIVWGYRERPAFAPQWNDDTVTKLVTQEGLDTAVAQLREHLRLAASEEQATFITVSYPAPDEVRYYNGEVTLLREETLRLLLAENWLETRTFGNTLPPLLEEAVRDIVDAFQVDGLTRSQAWDEAIRGGIVSPEDFPRPLWFYRPLGAFRSTQEA